MIFSFTLTSKPFITESTKIKEINLIESLPYNEEYLDEENGFSEQVFLNEVDGADEIKKDNEDGQITLEL